ncbi:hypothetical protein C8J26_2918 [Sphingomonas aurantiaca]|uniref:Uncharacterized protein n=1 Tax=Sphingomonas aurantiaca TaxID=185949 RepID=A0A2T5GIQ1_9SPHN|nr:hypothetical protein C8J26_2918 [Sphingomonas aurantiaca]
MRRRFFCVLVATGLMVLRFLSMVAVSPDRRYNAS